MVMKNIILATYEVAYGQSVNLQESDIFGSKKVPQILQNSITNILGVMSLGIGKYLGLPSMVGRSRNSTFRFIKDGI
jgi:hypothetical protein